MIWLKLLSGLLGFFDIISGWIERAQIRSAVRTEVERDALKETIEAMREDKLVTDRIRRDPARFDELLIRYQRPSGDG